MTTTDRIARLMTAAAEAGMTTDAGTDAEYGRDWWHIGSPYGDDRAYIYIHNGRMIAGVVAGGKSEGISLKQLERRVAAGRIDIPA